MDPSLFVQAACRKTPNRVLACMDLLVWFTVAALTEMKSEIFYTLFSPIYFSISLFPPICFIMILFSASKPVGSVLLPILVISKYFQNRYKRDCKKKHSL